MEMKKAGRLALPVLLSFVFIAALLWWLGSWNYVYMEHLRTFYYDSSILGDMLHRPGGACDIVADYLIQWFYNPVAAVLLPSALLTLVTVLVAALMRSFGSGRGFGPLALLPAVSLAFLQCNTNYRISGTVALALALGAALAAEWLFSKRSASCSESQDRSARRGKRYPVYPLIAVVIGLALYCLCGSAAIIYSILVVAFALRRRRVLDALLMCAVPVAVLVIAYACIAKGYFPSWARAITPEAYFNARLQPATYVYMPWAMLLVALTVPQIRLPHKKHTAAMLYAVSSLTVIAFAIFGVNGSVDRDGLVLKQLNCYIREGRWDRVEALCDKLPQDNLLWQNCRNLALAEQGRLADELFLHPCYDIRSIYITGDSSPYMYMLLSDIYYSMGHIALAQRHAFEANESLGNLSPRMLQRLVDTNIEYGQYPVAMKYIRLLEKTSHYADWAAGRRRMIEQGTTDNDPDIAAKRACIFPDNRFSAIGGLDADLSEVIRTNPGHRATIQYLGCLYLLSKDLPAFRALIDEHYRTSALPEPLPEAFAEGIYVVAESDSVSASYGIGPDMDEKYDRFAKDPRNNTDNLWYFLKYVQ